MVHVFGTKLTFDPVELYANSRLGLVFGVNVWLGLGGS